MTSTSVTLRQLAEAATPGPWEQPEQGPRFALSVYARGHVVATAERVGRGKADARLIALAPALTVWAADAADALDEIEGSPEDPLHVQKVARSVLARLGDLVAHPADDRGTVSSLGSGPVVYKSGKPRVGCLKGQRHDWGAA